ncbi:MAG: hypothetical protein F6K62_10570 [Sphaerospermopsis sp. SIO1G2]|nr:hypothetical protein [Sphaerospermopsis sp. SIO1G2]
MQMTVETIGILAGLSPEVTGILDEISAAGIDVVSAAMQSDVSPEVVAHTDLGELSPSPVENLRNDVPYIG